MSDKPDSSVKIFSYADDQPHEGRGLLIPRKGTARSKHAFTPVSTRPASTRTTTRVALSIFGLCALLVLGTSGYGLVAESSQSASPVVTILDPYTHYSTTLEYGSQEALSGTTFFLETRDAFIDEGLTFIEADMANEQLRFFKKGVLLQSAEILNVGADGSWWETPSGLYKVEKKDEQLFNSAGQVYLPWLLTFQGNYLIHGWPSYPNDDSVSEDFDGGGIRLSDKEAEALYEEVKVGMPILVHSVSKPKSEAFVYEPQVPELKTDHYFIADIENGTILASSELNESVPIASLAKLMTAVVASEKINLDDRIRVTSPTFVTSLIPRLSERSSVSMYSLLQLLLVESSNEAAETIAGEVGREEFIEDMNTKARQLGLMQTNFADPSGLSSGNTSSVNDLYKLTKYIYDQKRFIFDMTANQTLSNVYIGDEFGRLINFNEIEEMDSFVGGKVGETIAAGQTSVSLHKMELQGEERVVVVILLGSENRNEDVETLVSYTQNRFGN